MIKSKAFFAYPEANALVRDAIHGAASNNSGANVSIKLWQKMNILGFKLDDLIREEIQDADVLIADITHPNPNVLYELGYAMASGKPVLPTVNTAIMAAHSNVTGLGLFDTTGYAGYTNSDDLFSLTQNWEAESWVSKYALKRDYAQPLYILDAVKKTDFRNWIFHAIEESEVNFRSFDPAEVPRLTAAQALADVSSSAGVVIPLLSTELVDSERHNLRGAFLLGLAHGSKIDALVIQYENGPAPLDYRDFVRNSSSRLETLRHVSEYCQGTLVSNQRPANKAVTGEDNILGDIDLGSSAAENESQQLNQYFVETAEFSRALRAEGAVIAGRKGSGKSAVFLQVAEHFKGAFPAVCVVDLRPASHDLSEMREALTSVMSAGVFDHTIAAFWQYILYTEILLKLREMVLPKSRNNFELIRQLAEIESRFSLDDSVVSGDFTSRLKTAVELVVAKARTARNSEALKGELTNMMFEEPIPALREAVLNLAGHFNGIHILLDDLDKGWPPRRVELQDVAMVKHLIETLNRIGRDLRRKDVNFYHLLFLRSDIYERLVEQTSDRGKYNVINIDWSDPEQLRHMLNIRVTTSLNEADVDRAWEALNPTMASGDAIENLIYASLMRPRFLIDLCERMLSFAVNRGHHVVEDGDVKDAIAQMSLYLVSDFGYEMRDIAGTPEDIFYRFIGAGERLTQEQLEDLISSDELGLGVTETIDLLLWYGFLGIFASNGKPTFIYDRAYDFRRLKAEKRAAADTVRYVVNPAFVSGLST
ncbi:MAG: P-loop ATPase, Sll1717 family [Sulfitobacter sp.]|uniref:P-loop ATPase, Sll1717 family n=1 Tax=Sulfitobacter sp. TaxID=1903071 RepID=UPI004058446F